MREKKTGLARIFYYRENTTRLLKVVKRDIPKVRISLCGDESYTLFEAKLLPVQSPALRNNRNEYNILLSLRAFPRGDPTRQTVLRRAGRRSNCPDDRLSIAAVIADRLGDTAIDKTRSPDVIRQTIVRHRPARQSFFTRQNMIAQSEKRASRSPTDDFGFLKFWRKISSRCCVSQRAV